MLVIKAASDKPCFICSSAEKTVEVTFADKTFRGVLCLKHIWEKLKKEPVDAESQPGRKSA
jgi:hypothetical protein